MRVDFVGSESVALHEYLQKLIDQWPHVSSGWTPEQHRVWRAFQQLEGALDRDGLLLPSCDYPRCKHKRGHIGAHTI